MRKKAAPIASPHYVGSVAEQVLATLVHRPGTGLNVSELAAYTGQSPATVARAVDQAITDGAPLQTTVHGRSRHVSITANPNGRIGQHLAREVLIRQGYEADDIIDLSTGLDDDSPMAISADGPYDVRGHRPIGFPYVDLNEDDTQRPAPYLPDHLTLPGPLAPDASVGYELPGETYPEQPGPDTITVGTARILGALALGIDDQLDLMDRALTLAAGTSNAHRTTHLARWIRHLATTIPQPGRVLVWAAAHAERRECPYIGDLSTERARADLTEAYKQLTAAREYLERCAGIGDAIAAFDVDLVVRARQIDTATTNDLRTYLEGQQTRDQSQRDELAAKATTLSGEIGGSDTAIGGEDERLLRGYLTQAIHLCEEIAEDFPTPASQNRRTALR